MRRMSIEQSDPEISGKFIQFPQKSSQILSGFIIHSKCGNILCNNNQLFHSGI